MVALILETLIAAALAWGSSYLAWWAPLIVFPLIVGFGNHQYQAPMAAAPDRVLFDTLLMLQQIAWIIVAALICYFGFNAWWGALLGIMFGFFGCGIMAPRRWAVEARIER